MKQRAITGCIDALFESQREAFARLLAQVLQAMLEAQMTDFVGASAGERSRARKGHRAGHRERGLDTRAGRIALHVPRDRERRFATELFDRYPPGEAAFIAALAAMQLCGVTPARVRDAAQPLCGQSFSARTATSIAVAIKAALAGFAAAPLAAACTGVVLQVRRERLVVDGVRRERPLLAAIGIDRNGVRRPLGVAIAQRDAPRSVRQLLRQLERGGLRGARRLLAADRGLAHRVARRVSIAGALAALPVSAPTTRPGALRGRQAARRPPPLLRDPWVARARRLTRGGVAFHAGGRQPPAGEGRGPAPAGPLQTATPVPREQHAAALPAADADALVSIRHIADHAYRQWVEQLAESQREARPSSARELFVAAIDALRPSVVGWRTVVAGGAGIAVVAALVHATWVMHDATPEAAASRSRTVATAPEAGERSAGPVETMPATRHVHRLVGVSALDTAEGVALIATDGNPARPYRVGEAVERGLVLLGVGAGGAILGSPGGQPGLTLEVAAETVAAGITTPAAAATAPSTATADDPTLPAADLVPDALTPSDSPAGKPSPGRRLRLQRPVSPR